MVHSLLSCSLLECLVGVDLGSLLCFSGLSPLIEYCQAVGVNQSVGPYSATCRFSAV